MKGFYIVMIAVCLSGSPLLAENSGGTAPLSASDIFSRLEQQNAVRAEQLRSYSSVRHYSVSEKDKPSDAEMTVLMQYQSPSTKTFRVTSERGLGWVHNVVFRRLMRTEQETSSGEAKVRSSIISANYDVGFDGEEQFHGRSCYVLDLRPKRRDKYLVEGKMWVDKQDFAVARLEGEPSKSFSFWVTRAHIIRDYQKVGDYWLPLLDETHARVRVAGEYTFRIEHTDYHLNQ